MCGRFTLTAAPEAVRRLFGYIEQPNFPPRYNIAPTQPVAIVYLNGTRQFLLVRWGLVPGWVKDFSSFPLMFNARAETAAEKPAFRAAMRHRRCLIPASGFYEWHRSKSGRQAFFVRPRDGGIIAFAGVYETWLGADGSEVDTMAILTTAPNRLMATIHDRMPVIVAPEHFDRWLDVRAYEPKAVSDLLVPAPNALLEAIPVSERVNAAANDDASVQAPLAEPVRFDDDQEW